MAIERRNPLPAGKYWVDVFEPHTSPFLGWLSKNQANLTVNTTERIQGDPEGNWILFTVRTPVLWEGPGYPSIAGQNIKTKADTSERPEPEELPNLDDVVKKVSRDTVKAVVIGFGTVLALKFLLSKR